MLGALAATARRVNLPLAILAAHVAWTAVMNTALLNVLPEILLAKFDHAVEFIRLALSATAFIAVCEVPIAAIAVLFDAMAVDAMEESPIIRIASGFAATIPIIVAFAAINATVE